MMRHLKGCLSGCMYTVCVDTKMMPKRRYIKLTTEHKNALRLLVEGQRQAEVITATGYSRSTIARLMVSAGGRRYMTRLQRAAAEEALQIAVEKAQPKERGMDLRIAYLESILNRGAGRMGR
jgi:hypothetical protein